MKKFIGIVVFVLLGLALISRVIGSQYVGLTGFLNNIGNIDFSFSDTTQVAIQAFEKFEAFGSGNDIVKGIISATTGLFDLIRVPFVAIWEILQLIGQIFDFLFSLVGTF